MMTMNIIWADEYLLLIIRMTKITGYLFVKPS